VRSCGIKTGVDIRLGLRDREWLEAVVASRNSPQKHVWRARIVLLSADGIGTMEIHPSSGPQIRTVSSKGQALQKCRIVLTPVIFGSGLFRGQSFGTVQHPALHNHGVSK